jgi:alpha-beta hydrolase superfamily lysophospholipase
MHNLTRAGVAMTSRLTQLSAATARRVWRLSWRLLALLAALCLTLTLGFTLYAVTELPTLQPWHKVRLHEEFTALHDSDLDFNGYLKLEDRLFDEMRAVQASWDQGNEELVYSRFNPASPLSRLAPGAPYNHSFRLTPAKPIGQALLIQGLTDSPYSMKTLADSLYARDFEVTVLRLPGHGTFPSMMTEMSLRDWTAAVRIAARDVATRTPANQPFYIGGYSTGGTLALQYTLDSLQNTELRRPDRVLLISPAITLVKLASISAFIDAFSIVPVPVLEKVRWQDIIPEYDPYKFNSFPINATRQVNRATKELQSSLARARDSGLIENMPPVVTWQSVVDSTVGPEGSANILYPSLKGAKNRLTLFDVNRHKALGSIQRPTARALIDRLMQNPRDYTLEIVGNCNANTLRACVLRLTPDNVKRTRETTLKWSDDVVSLTHVALPFPPNDPVYGYLPGSGKGGVPSIGSWLLRGESGATSVALGSLTRLRSNPFWALIDQEVGELVSTDTLATSRD